MSTTTLIYLSHRLSDALKQTGFADALKKLNLDSGAGSDGDLSRLGSLGRTGDGAGCTKVLDNWKKFNSSGDKAVPGGWGQVSLDIILYIYICRSERRHQRDGDQQHYRCSRHAQQ